MGAFVILNYMSKDTKLTIAYIFWIGSYLLLVIESFLGIIIKDLPLTPCKIIFAALILIQGISFGYISRHVEDNHVSKRQE